MVNARDMAVLKNIVRIGIVSSVDPEERTARVIFPDKLDTEGNPLISGPLKVVINQPLIAFKKWTEDNSVPGEEPDTIAEIDITEGANPDYEGIYHSANRNLGLGEKYAIGKLGEYEPDYIKQNSEEELLIKVYPWLPYIGQFVLCVYLPNGESDGFVIGGI